MVRVLRAVYDGMISHVLQSPTEESCGLLSGRHGTITRQFRTDNVAENKTVRYEAAPLYVRRILEEIDPAGEQHLGIYHSHPNSPAYPSATDRKLAAYDVTCFVISLKTRAKPSLRAFRIVKQSPTDEEAEVHEETVEIVDAR